MNSKGTLIAIALALVSLLVLAYSMFLSYQSNPEKLTPDIAYLTPSVHSFSGTVEEVRDNKITVRYETLQQTDAFIFTTPLPKKTLRYTVTISGNTRIKRETAPMDYYQKTGFSEGSKSLTVQDIKKEQKIAVLTKEDLRYVKNGALTATQIELPPIEKMISGIIETGENGRFTIKPTASTQNQSVPFTLAEKAKIYKNSFDGSPAPSLITELTSQSSLKPGMLIQVYLKNGVNEQPYEAVRVDFTEYATAITDGAENPSSPSASQTDQINAFAIPQP